MSFDLGLYNILNVEHRREALHSLLMKESWGTSSSSSLDEDDDPSNSSSSSSSPLSNNSSNVSVIILQEVCNADKAVLSKIVPKAGWTIHYSDQNNTGFNAVLLRNDKWQLVASTQSSYKFDGTTSEFDCPIAVAKRIDLLRAGGDKKATKKKSTNSKDKDDDNDDDDNNNAPSTTTFDASTSLFAFGSYHAPGGSNSRKERRTQLEKINVTAMRSLQKLCRQHSQPICYFVLGDGNFQQLPNREFVRLMQTTADQTMCKDPLVHVRPGISKEYAEYGCFSGVMRPDPQRELYDACLYSRLPLAASNKTFVEWLWVRPLLNSDHEPVLLKFLFKSAGDDDDDDQKARRAVVEAASSAQKKRQSSQAKAKAEQKQAARAKAEADAKKKLAEVAAAHQKAKEIEDALRLEEEENAELAARVAALTQQQHQAKQDQQQPKPGQENPKQQQHQGENDANAGNNNKKLTIPTGTTDDFRKHVVKEITKHLGCGRAAFCGKLGYSDKNTNPLLDFERTNDAEFARRLVNFVKKNITVVVEAASAQKDSDSSNNKFPSTKKFLDMVAAANPTSSGSEDKSSTQTPNEAAAAAQSTSSSAVNVGAAVGSESNNSSNAAASSSSSSTTTTGFWARAKHEAEQKVIALKKLQQETKRNAAIAEKAREEAERKAHDVSAWHRTKLQSHAGIDNCPKCQKPFGIFRWKYNCRGCGLCLCDDCCPEREVPNRFGGKKSDVRICKDCAPEVEEEPASPVEELLLSPLRAAACDGDDDGGGEDDDGYDCESPSGSNSPLHPSRHHHHHHSRQSAFVAETSSASFRKSLVKQIISFLKLQSRAALCGKMGFSSSSTNPLVYFERYENNHLDVAKKLADYLRQSVVELKKQQPDVVIPPDVQEFLDSFDEREEFDFC